MIPVFNVSLSNSHVIFSHHQIRCIIFCVKIIDWDWRNLNETCFRLPIGSSLIVPSRMAMQRGEHSKNLFTKRRLLSFITIIKQISYCRETVFACPMEDILNILSLYPCSMSIYTVVKTEGRPARACLSRRSTVFCDIII